MPDILLYLASNTGTDGAAVNVSEQNGMKGKLQHVMPWLFWAWCYVHRLELACKDALTNCSKMLRRCF